MEAEVVVNYINVDRMIDEIYKKFRDCRDSYETEDNVDFLLLEFPDEWMQEEAIRMTYGFNNDMKKYLNSDDHRICGNFNNIDYDYPHHINGEFEYNPPLVKAMIDRLNANEESEQANADRDWLVDWFWETFGSFDVTYNLSEEIADFLYKLENNENYE